MGGIMRSIRTITLAALVACAALTMTACEDGQDAAAPETEKSVPVAAEEEPESGGVAGLPDFTGETLQAAQDGAQAAGFYLLDSEDASGQGRMQVLDRNWTVCQQSPDAGSHSTETMVTFTVVKDGEVC